MTPREALYYRALRILTDGQEHAHTVIRWAQEMTEARQRTSAEELRQAGFSLREISLGASEVYSQ